MKAAKEPEKGEGTEAGAPPASAYVEVENARVIVVETLAEYIGDATPEDIGKLNNKEPIVLKNAHRIVPMEVNQAGQVISSMSGPYELHVIQPLTWRPATPNEARAFNARVHSSKILQVPAGALAQLGQVARSMGR